MANIMIIEVHDGILAVSLRECGVLEGNMLFPVCAETVDYCLFFRRCHHFVLLAMDSAVAEWRPSPPLLRILIWALLAHRWMV